MRPAEIKGVDTLRFAAALCVSLSHGAAFPLAAYFPERSGALQWVIGIYDSAFDGLAAVLVFFLVSGFCIHYAFARGVRFRPAAFLLRRMIRIAAPLIVAASITKMLGPKAEAALDLVLWSLYIEIIYYIAYPILRLVFAKYGLVNVTAISFLVSIFVIATHWSTAYFQELPLPLTALALLPAWLAGCLLAEKVAARDPIPDANNIWLWRFAAWGYSVSAALYFFHGNPKIGEPALLTPFYIFSYFWLFKEIGHFSRSGTSKGLEWCGKWSYSLYLTHRVSLVMLDGMSSDMAISWIISIVGIFAVSLVFYMIVELPSHKIARAAARRLNGEVVLV